MKPKKADVRSNPSMPMLTTPVRSEQIPVSAPNVIGVACVIVTVRMDRVAAGPNCTPVRTSRRMPMADQKAICSSWRAWKLPPARAIVAALAVISSGLGLTPACAELDVNRRCLGLGRDPQAVDPADERWRGDENQDQRLHDLNNVDRDLRQEL